MVSKNRGIESGYVYHVLNRGVLRNQLFDTDCDYIAFEELILETFEEIPLPIFTYELMPNHWHFVVQATDSDDEISDFFHLLTGTHAKRFRAWHENVGIGHVYQDRFKSFPVQCDDHFLTLCRYVERNALRAGLVESAEEWRWAGLWRRIHGQLDFLYSDWPVERPSDWLDWVNRPLTSSELSAIETSVRRGTPFGDQRWTLRTAADLKLQHTLRGRGRPRRLSRRLVSAP